MKPANMDSRTLDTALTTVALNSLHIVNVPEDVTNALKVEATRQVETLKEKSQRASILKKALTLFELPSSTDKPASGMKLVSKHNSMCLESYCVSEKEEKALKHILKKQYSRQSKSSTRRCIKDIFGKRPPSNLRKQLSLS